MFGKNVPEILFGNKNFLRILRFSRQKRKFPVFSVVDTQLQIIFERANDLAIDKL